MKLYANFFLLILLFANCGNKMLQHEGDFKELNKIDLRGVFLEVNNQENLSHRIPLKCLRKEMTQILETPDSVIVPQYECGSFSIHQEESYSQFFYHNMNFIGTEEEMMAEKVLFSDNTRLSIRGRRIHGEMNMCDVLDALNVDGFFTSHDEEKIFIYPKRQKGYFCLEFKEGKLYKLEMINHC